MKSQEFLFNYNTSDYENTRFAEAQAFEILYARCKERHRKSDFSFLMGILKLSKLIIK